MERESFYAEAVGHIFSGVTRAGAASGRPYEGESRGGFKNPRTIAARWAPGKSKGKSNGNGEEKKEGSLTLDGGFGMTAQNNSNSNCNSSSNCKGNGKSKVKNPTRKYGAWGTRQMQIPHP